MNSPEASPGEELKASGPRPEYFLDGKRGGVVVVPMMWVGQFPTPCVVCFYAKEEPHSKALELFYGYTFYHN